MGGSTLVSGALIGSSTFLLLVISPLLVLLNGLGLGASLGYSITLGGATELSGFFQGLLVFTAEATTLGGSGCVSADFLIHDESAGFLAGGANLF